jgi:glycosyltransferase involved in cell wall biosynthesis
MRIGIDARFLTHPQKGGFKTYTENLISALAEIDTENSYLLYLDRIPDEATKLPMQSNFRYRVIDGQNPVLGMFWREQISLPYFASIDKLDLLHSPCLTAPLRLRCASIVTIHDMIWFSSHYSSKESNSIKRMLMNWYYHCISKHSADKASLLITVSTASKERITLELGIPAEKVLITYEGINPIFRQISDITRLWDVRKKYNLISDYILAIGSADPRKNITTLIQAYSQLPEDLKSDYQLVIILTHPLMADVLMKQTVDLYLANRIHFIKQVDDEELVLLYNAASLFVFPSLEEGFGLPPLEAMACGTPVIAGKNSSMPEILQDAAILTEAKDPDKIAYGIQKILTDSELKTKLIRKGYSRYVSFSWKKCAIDTISAYKKAVFI